MANGLFGGGDGSSSYPYRVEDAADLKAVRNNLSAYYIQTMNIDLSYVPGFIPIGVNIDPTTGEQVSYSYFTGNYNGLGFEIRGLSCSHIDFSFVGLFACVSGTVENIKLIDCVVSAFYLRRVIGTNIGGISGAIVGRGEINNCHVTGNISGNAYIGGIVGQISPGATRGVSRCSSNCNVSGITLFYITQGFGGIAGYNGGPITDCYAIGTVQAELDTGGLVGINNGTVTNCYAAARVIRDEIENRKEEDKLKDGLTFGGLIGTVETKSKIYTSYYDRYVSEQNDSEKGQGLSTSSMITASTYSNWNKNTWIIYDGNYPIFPNYYLVQVNVIDPDGNRISEDYYDTNIKISGKSYTDYDYMTFGERSTILLYISGQHVIEMSCDKTGYIPFYLKDVVFKNTEFDIGTKPYDMTKRRTYYVSTPADVMNMKDPIGIYIQTKDIDFKGVKYKVPFVFDKGSFKSKQGFMGDYDGKGFKIKNLTIDVNAQVDYRGVGIGFIGQAINATIKNVNFENMTFLENDSRNPLGCIYGSAFQVLIDENNPDGTNLFKIENCSVKNASFEFGSYYSHNAAALIGTFTVNYDALEFLSFDYDFAFIKDTKATGIIFNAAEGFDMGYVAGAISYFEMGWVELSEPITLFDGVEVNVYANCGNSYTEYIAGLIACGYGNASVKFERVGVNITLNNASSIEYCGGLFGYVGLYFDAFEMNDFYVNMTIQESSEPYGVGAIGGYFERWSDNETTKFNRGYIVLNTELTENDGTDLGMVFGEIWNESSIDFTDFYIDNSVNKISSDTYGAELKPTADMVQESTYLNFDFDETWKIASGVSYPIFKLDKQFMLCKSIPLNNYRR